MLVAIETFPDPTDGRSVRAGITRVSEDAEVALLFPDRFQPAPARHFAGRGRLATRAPDGRRASVAAEKLPRLFSTPARTYCATLARSAHLEIRREIRAVAADFDFQVETGGWLLSDPSTSNLIVHATGPGANGRHSRSSVELDFSEAEGSSAGLSALEPEGLLAHASRYAPQP